MAMSQKLRKPLRWLIAVLGVLLGLALIGLLFRDSILKLAARKTLQACTGMRVEIAKFKTGLRTPAVEMQGFKLYNYPEFGDSVLLDVPDLLVEFDSELASQGKLRFKQLRVNLAELNVIRDAAGRWNIEKVEKEMTERNAARTNRQERRLEFAGIDDLRLTIGRINYTDQQKPTRSRQIDVNIHDELVQGIKTDEDLQDWIGNFLFKVILPEVASSTAKRRHKPVATLKEALER
jgi:hypothetical protein